MSNELSEKFTAPGIEDESISDTNSSNKEMNRKGKVKRKVCSYFETKILKWIYLQNIYKWFQKNERINRGIHFRF